MKLSELFEEKYEPHPALKSSGLKRIRSTFMAELDGESKWELGDDLQLNVINAGRTAVIYFKSRAPEGVTDPAPTIKKGWLMPLDKRHKADFIKMYPWLENISDKGSFDIENNKSSDFEDWIGLWKNRKQ